MGGALYITDSVGNPNVFNVNHDDDDQWLNANNGHADNFWNADNRFAFVPRNSLQFSPNLGEFFFCNWPIHPPSIRPISSIFKESAIYFLLSSDFVSQRTINNIFSVSIFLMAMRT